MAERSPNDVGAARESDPRTVLKRHGLRYSKPRAAIVRYLLERDRHVSAEGLAGALEARGEGVSLSTVYLNLGVLCEHGLLRAFTGLGGETLYDSNLHPHAHLVCTETGEVRDVDLPTIDGEPLMRYLKRSIERETGWTIEEPRLHLRGVARGADDAELD